jgi:hypothetical protein
VPLKMSEAQFVPGRQQKPPHGVHGGGGGGPLPLPPLPSPSGGFPGRVQLLRHSALSILHSAIQAALNGPLVPAHTALQFFRHLATHAWSTQSARVTLSAVVRGCLRPR